MNFAISDMPKHLNGQQKRGVEIKSQQNHFLPRKRPLVEIESQKPTKSVRQTEKMQEALKSFKDYLAGNKLKLTQQRLLIFKVFMSDDNKLSTESLLSEVQDVDDTISRSTVYRTVKHLHDAGIARCIHHNDGVTYYEPMGDQSSRMICERCGKVIPIKNPYFECLQQETARQQGFTLFRYQNVIHGLCCECSKITRSCQACPLKNNQ